MASKVTIDIINNNLNELNKFISSFSKHDKISRIDIDLALSKMRDVYDLLLTLKESSAMIKQEENKLDRVGEKAVVIPGNMEKTEIVVEEVPRSNATVSKKIIADTFKEKQNSVNELIAKGKQKDDVSSKLLSKSIDDVNAAIGLNDKFLFIKELFRNDKQQYQQAIAHLNTLHSYEEALIYLERDLMLDKENATSKNFLEIIRRKFTR